MKKKILLFHYFGGAGGKFIANCLSYNKQVAFSNYEKAIAVLSSKNLNLLEQSLLNTIPDKINSREWLYLEQGCHQLFGKAIIDIRLGNLYDSTNLNDLSKLDNIWLPLMTHTIQDFDRLKSFFYDDEIFTVLVDSTVEFIDLAIRKKWREEHHCINLDGYKKFKEDCKLANFDFCFDNWNPLITENHTMITDLANKIGTNFDLNLCKKYVEKYINFHI